MLIRHVFPCLGSLFGSTVNSGIGLARLATDHASCGLVAAAIVGPVLVVLALLHLPKCSSP